MRLSRITIFLMVVWSMGCVSPISLDYPGVGNTLVVEGWITNQPGPYTIKLSRSVPYDNSKPLKVYTIPETKAKVSIVDDQGVTEMVNETTTAGTYKTGSLTGAVGRSYQLRIETATGVKYRSQPELMTAGPAIEKLEALFQVSEVLITNANGSSRVQKKEDFALYVSVNDPAEVDNYYRWSAEGIFEYFSVSDFLPTHCWAPLQSRIETRLELANDLHFNGQPYRQFLGLIAYDRPTYFMVNLSQSSLSPAAYKFLKQLSDQQVSTGTLFDPPPTAIAGNIYNEANDKEIVLGYFGASEMKKVNLLINRFKESGFVNPSRYVAPTNGDCRPQQAGSTIIKPPGFPG